MNSLLILKQLIDFYYISGILRLLFFLKNGLIVTYESFSLINIETHKMKIISITNLRECVLMAIQQLAETKKSGIEMANIQRKFQSLAKDLYG